MCEAWWAEVQRLARAEGAATRVLEYSFVFSHEAGTLEQRLAIWVVSGATGELLSSKVVSSTGLGGSRGRSIQKVLAEARSSMNVRGRDAMRDARNARGRGRRNTRGGDRGHLFSYLLKLGQEYARAFRAVSADSRGLEFAQVRPGGQNIPSQAAPAQTITFLPGCTDRSAASSASVSLFEKMPAEVLLNYVFPQLDFMSLMNLLYSCKTFRNLEVMHPPQTAARSFVVKTALQHINILDACNLDLEMILDPEIIRAWMAENDGSEVLDFNYFDFYKRQFYRQPAGELGDQDDTPQTGTSFSFWEYLGRERPDPGDSDEKLEWFTHEIDSELNTIRDKVLESFTELHNPPADHLTIQTQQVCAALIRKRYASLTCSQTDGSSFSVFDQLRHEVEQRRAAAVDLLRRLQDVNETLLFHSILHKLSKGELECVEEWIEKWIGIYRDGEMEATVSTGAPTRNATERANPSGVAEREQIIRAWALEMLHKLRVRSFEREMGGVVGYCNNFSHLAQSYSSHQTTGAASERKKVKETWEVIRKKQHAEEIASETSLLKELYQALIAPVEGALEGAEEVLIVPHKELFEVPWAALTDADGGYLIERYVIRTSPSLRVARQATDKMQQDGNEPRGHVVLVGNPLPTRLGPLCFAENEVKDIEKTLKMAHLEVLEEHYFRSNQTPPATKTNVKRSLEGATWVHVACHADLETDALVLADPSNGTDQDSDLTMHEVQGSEGAKGVRLAQGATVVLSACNTGRGEIKAEGVVGLARGFMLANASATVVSLWSVDDGSTAALMCITYQHLAQTQGCTVPQALRLAMLRLARRPDPLAVTRHDGDGARGSSGGGSTTGVYQVLPLFLSIHSFLLPSPSPSHTSRHPLSVSYFSSKNIEYQILMHTPTTFRQTQFCETAAKSKTKPFLPRMLRTG
jgi:CHAT domain-containing protein